MPFGFFEEIESDSNSSGDKVNLTKQRDFSLENAPIYPGVQTPQVERSERS